MSVVTERVGGRCGLWLVVALLVLLATPAVAQDAPPGDLSIEVFTRIGSPGQPDGLYVTSDRVYVGTHNAGAGDRDVASKLFEFDHDGNATGEFTIEGQDIDADNGILAMARDADGVLYIADREPPRIIALDPATGEQSTYATFRDVPVCTGDPDGTCSAALADMADFTDQPVFAPDGTMYVTDLQQALIWRVPPGGGEGEIWLTDPRFDSVFGINHLQFRPDGRTLLMSVTANINPTAADPGIGYLYETVIGDDGQPGELTTFWESGPGDGPDGFFIAASGRVYVPLAGTNGVAVISPEGEEVARVPSDPVSNQLQEIPFDTPVAVAFLGNDILVANQSFFAGDSTHWAVFRINAGEPGMALYEPSVAAAPAATPTPSPAPASPTPASTPAPAPSAVATPSPAAPAPTAAGRLPATGGGNAAWIGALLLAAAVGSRRLRERGTKRFRANA